MDEGLLVNGFFLLVNEGNWLGFGFYFVGIDVFIYICRVITTFNLQYI